MTGIVTEVSSASTIKPGIGGEAGTWAVPTHGVDRQLSLQTISAQVGVIAPTVLKDSEISGVIDFDDGSLSGTSSKSSDSTQPSQLQFGSKMSSRPRMSRRQSFVSIGDRDEILQVASRQRLIEELDESGATFSLANFLVLVRYIFAICQLYSLPLTVGVVTALAWSNADADSYHKFTESQIVNGAVLLGHDVSLHFIVNDFFMCFFFGLAVKEVTEALLPGGCLNPLRRAINPIFATVGGVLGPIVVYQITVSVMYSSGGFDETDCSEGISSSHRRLGEQALPNRTLGGHHGDAAGECTLAALAKGWGVPTATDISLAWMFSLIVFGTGHPAINFMLLLAILDDAIGMLIIAVFYPDPMHPVKPVWLLLVGVAVALALLLRKLKVRSWCLYIAACGPVSWLGLIMAHVHPALALVLVVPCLPATRALHVADGSIHNLGACDLGPSEQPVGQSEDERPSVSRQRESSDTSEEAQPEEEPVTPVSPYTSEKPSPYTSEKPPRWHSCGGSSVSSLSFTRMSHTSEAAASVRAVASVREAAQFLKARTSTLLGLDENDAPLHAFEAALKTPVDFGMFFFGLANAGVPFQAVGNLTGAVLISLCVGKIVGICGCSLLAARLGFGLPTGLGWGDMVAMSALAGIGLTVALFLANEAFVQPELRDQAKMGAVLSVGCAIIAWPIRKMFGQKEQDCNMAWKQAAKTTPTVAASASSVNAIPVIEVNVNVSCKLSRVAPISSHNTAWGS